MKKILIIGASGHAKVIIDIIEKQAVYEIVGLIDTYKKKGDRLFDYSILGSEEDISSIIKSRGVYGGIIAIGDNFSRMKMYKKIKSYNVDFKFITAIHPSACIGKNVIIKNGTCIMAGTVINSDAQIGKQCIINTKSSVGHDCTLKSFSSIAPGVTLGGNVKIGKNSAILIGASIIESITIGTSTVIGAHSLVITSFGNNLFAYGHPAKKIKNRKKDSKYMGLKTSSEGKPNKNSTHSANKTN